MHKYLISIFIIAFFSGWGAPVSGATVCSNSSTVCGLKTPISKISAEGYPTLTLENSQLKVLVYPPDPAIGYYRGSRFDWSGMIGKVEFKGHTFFDKWRIPHDPKSPDHGIGAAEEFDMDTPPLYDTGSSFVKIGVGILSRPQGEEKYFFNNAYTVSNPAPFSITADKKCICFTQKVADIGRSFGYTYTKKLIVKDNRIIIHHSLTNTGKTLLSTETYSHNFISIDGDTIGPDYAISFPFVVRVADNILKAFEGRAQFDGVHLKLLKPLSGSLWASFDSLKGLPLENKFSIQNTRTGAQIDVAGTRAPSKYNFYAESRAICPEPFVQVSVQPGATQTWDNTLTFSVRKK